MKYRFEDTFAFGQDIAKGDQIAVMFKTAGNIKR